jgi:hypothetical protein
LAIAFKKLGSSLEKICPYSLEFKISGKKSKFGEFKYYEFKVFAIS